MHINSLRSSNMCPTILTVGALVISKELHCISPKHMYTGIPYVTLYNLCYYGGQRSRPNAWFVNFCTKVLLCSFTIISYIVRKLGISPSKHSSWDIISVIKPLCSGVTLATFWQFYRSYCTCLWFVSEFRLIVV